MFEQIAEKFSSLFGRFSGNGTLEESKIAPLLLEVQNALLEADVPLAVAEQFIAELKQDLLGKKIPHGLKPAEYLMKMAHDRVAQFLGGAATGAFTFQIPSTVLVMGLQGAGKTTTLGKLARLIMAQAEKRGKTRRVLLASVDYYRPAAIEQLELLAQRVGCLFYRATSNNPVEAAREIVRYAEREHVEILLLDTAGRLHMDEQLLQELAAIDALVKPKYKLLVVDGMMGQESLKVAQAFHDRIGFTGGIVTKMDSNARAGVTFAFRYALQKPLLYMGTGEGLDDFEPFMPDRVAKRMLDMGDMATLVEKAEEKIKQSEHDRLKKSFNDGRMTLQDFADQLSMVNKMGSLSSLMKYLPGMGQFKIDADMMQKGEQEMKQFRAIIGSMTYKERVYPKVLDNSRKKRIASGSGVTVADVNVLLERFEQNQQFVKMFKKMQR